MTKSQLEYLERIRQLVELAKDECNSAMSTTLEGILVNIEHIKQGEEK